ncbi:MAG: hypothetical protein H7281_18515 [Bacteriovorax sp.]|nr:hypothetical protein [Bacteriovorax sp.]
MRSLSLVVGLLCLFTVNTQAAQAKSADAFFKRFQVVRSADGKLVGIRDRTLPVKFSVAPYVKLIRSQLLDEQSLMSPQNLASGQYDSEIKSVIEDGMDQNLSGYQTQFDENVEVVVNSLKKLAVLNIDFIFTHEIFQDVVNQYQGKMTDAIMLLDPTMIANVNDSSYFYKKNVTYKAVTWGLDFARRRMSSIPMLNTVSYVIVQVEKLITERRQFHQNMLLHYLENFKEEELGLTHDEVNLIWSSIYESRIQWYAFWESSTAKNNWTKYGVNNFYLNFRAATTNLKNAQSIYSEVSDRMNFAFQKVTFNNEKVVVNLFDKESIFQNRPAVAFNYDRPTQIVRKRVVLNLAELGLSFVPMSAMIKDNVSTFIKSFYEQQKITEGALYGYFESNGDSKGQDQVHAQYLNPFDGLAL